MKARGSRETRGEEVFFEAQEWKGEKDRTLLRDNVKLGHGISSQYQSKAFLMVCSSSRALVLVEGEITNAIPFQIGHETLLSFLGAPKY